MLEFYAQLSFGCKNWSEYLDFGRRKRLHTSYCYSVQYFSNVGILMENGTVKEMNEWLSFTKGNDSAVKNDFIR